jgi:hypothetical protein
MRDCIGTKMCYSWDRSRKFPSASRNRFYSSPPSVSIQGPTSGNKAIGKQ